MKTLKSMNYICHQTIIIPVATTCVLVCKIRLDRHPIEAGVLRMVSRIRM